MTYAFVSYVREDNDLVDRLCTDLNALGVQTWRDRDRILPGQRWQNAIRDAIEEGGYFIACFSASYLAKSSSYMNEELTLAIEQLRKMPTARVWFIPVLLSDCTPPDRNIGGGDTLRDLQWVPLYEDWSAGLQSIAGVVSGVDAVDLATEIHKADSSHRTPDEPLTDKEASDECADAEEIIRAHCKAEWPGDYDMLVHCEGKQRSAVAQLGRGAPAGFPADIFARIRSKAASEWPEDFEMRLHTEGKQISAYRALESSSALDVPEDVFGVIRRKAAAEWPDDFEMRLHTEQKQLQTFRNQSADPPPGVPEDVFAAIRSKARSDWPDEFEMQQHTEEKQVQAYRALAADGPPDVPEDVFDRIAYAAKMEWPNDFEMQLHTLEKQLQSYRQISRR